MTHRNVMRRDQHTVPFGAIGAPPARWQPDNRAAWVGDEPPASVRPPPGLWQTRSPLSGELPADGNGRKRRYGAAPIAAMLKSCLRSLPWNRSLPRWRGTVDETIVASHGRMEIRLLPAGFVARTCVKGEVGQARETGLRRLAKYTRGDNLDGARLHAARLVVQQQVAPGRWLISVPLQTVGDDATAPCPRDTKIKLVLLDTEMFAVVGVS
jgi:hypothetical protein